MSTQRILMNAAYIFRAFPNELDCTETSQWRSPHTNALDAQRISIKREKLQHSLRYWRNSAEETRNELPETKAEKRTQTAQ